MSMVIRLRSLVVILISAMTVGCSTDDHLTENYWIYDDPIVVDGRHALMCKLGCDGDPIISDVVEVQWNDKVIMVTTRSGRHYVIIAKGNKLECCNGDSVIGPLDNGQLLSWIKQDGSDDVLMKRTYE